MANFRFIRLAAVHHYGFVLRVFGPPIVVFVTVQNVVAIGAVTSIVLYANCNILRVMLENAYSRLQNGSFKCTRRPCHVFMTFFRNAYSVRVVSSFSRSGQSQATKYISCIFEAKFDKLRNVTITHN